MIELPELIHHFSWATRISLELPLGFEEELEDDDAHVAIYGDDLDEDDPPGARVQTKATNVGTDDPAALRKLAEASADRVGGSREGPEELTVDHLPALQQVLRYRQEEIETDVVRHETFVQAGNVVFSITAITSQEDADRYLSAFDHAARTARIILI